MSGFGWIFGQVPKPKPSKWVEKDLGMLPRIEVELIQDIVKDHPNELGLEVKPSANVGVYIIGHAVKLFYHKEQEHKYKWAMWLFNKKKAELKEAQDKAQEYVLNAKTEADPAMHPENAYVGADPLLTWHPVKVPATDPIPGASADMTWNYYARHPLLTRMQIAEGGDPHWPFPF